MLFHVQPTSATPIYRQIAEQVREAIACGRLARGDQLPSLRQVAQEHVINYLTVKQAYDMLERDGLIQTRRGIGTFVQRGAAASLLKQVGADLEARLREVAAGARRAGLTQQQFQALARQAWRVAEESS